MAGLKQKKKTLRRVLRAGRLLAVRGGGILLGVISNSWFVWGGHFQISERYVRFILKNFMKIVQSSNEGDLKLNVKAVNSKHRTYKHDYE